MITLLEAVPLAVFLLYRKHMDTAIAQNWEAPFIVSGLLAVVVLLVLVYRKVLGNRIFLGINLYLLSGGLAFLTHQWWLNRLYDHLQASGMVLWIIITGIASTFLSTGGFIGVPSPDTKSVQRYSVYLIVVSVFAWAVSFGFRGSPILSELVPFIGLFGVQRMLKRRLAEDDNRSEP